MIVLVSAPVFGQEDCSKVQLQEKLNSFSERVGLDFLDEEDNFHSLQQEFKTYWSKCEKKMGEKAWNCFDNMQGFFETYSGVGTNASRMWLKVSDAEYFQKLGEKKSRLFTLPQNFFKENKLPKDWRERLDMCSHYYTALECRKINDWKALEFENFCSAKGKPNIKNVLFYFPDDEFDQWILFRSDTPLQKKGVSLPAQIIAVEKKEDRKQEGSVYFGELTSFGIEPSVGISCLKCHTNGPLTIIPQYGSIKTEDGLKRLGEFNEVISKYGRLKVPFMNEKYRGPQLGQSVGCMECHTSVGSAQKTRAPFYFMSPSIRDALVVRNDHPAHVFEKSFPWRSALEKAYDLSSKNLEEFRSMFGGESCTGKAALNTNKSIQDGLRFLQRKHEISEEDYAKARPSVLESHSHGNSVYQSFEVEAAASYKLWLRGGRENCVSGTGASPVDSPKAK